MKTKDLIYLLVAVAIFLGAGYVGYTQLVPKKAGSNNVTAEVVGNIPADMDKTGLSLLSDQTKSVDWGSPVDLTGLGNTEPFGK